MLARTAGGRSRELERKPAAPHRADQQSTGVIVSAIRSSSSYSIVSGG
jgi:hypothetical protein